MAHEIFISYSAADGKVANAVCQALEKASLSCWIAPRDITPGVKYAEALIDAINSCRIFLLILSATSNASPQLEMEFDRAASKNITILSFRIDPVTLSKTLEYYLSSRHWLDASAGPVEAHLPTLVQTAGRLLGTAIQTPIQIRPAEQVVRPAPETVFPDNMVRNPFTFGNPISDPERFFGRKQELRQILNRLLSSAHESTSIIGERRIGKTSLLLHLSHPKVAQSLGLLPDKFCLVYMDFQGLTDITPARFWQRVLKKMATTTCVDTLKVPLEKASKQKQFDMFDLEDLFQVLQEKGLTTVLMLDEFEYVTQNPNFKSDFFGGLRALAIHHGLTLLPATRRELVDLCHSDELKGSPFFNIFANVVLRPFSRAEVGELLDGYSILGAELLTTTEQEMVWGLGGGYPFFVQMAGYYVVEGKSQGFSGEPLEKFVVDAFYHQADAHYTYLWSHCSESEKIALLTLMALSLQDASIQAAPNLENLSRIRARLPQDLVALAKRGLVDEREQRYVLFSSSFPRWIQHEIVVPPGGQEDQPAAEHWLVSSKRENLQETKEILTKFKKKYWPVISEVIEELTRTLTGSGALEVLNRLI